MRFVKSLSILIALGCLFCLAQPFTTSSAQSHPLAAPFFRKHDSQISAFGFGLKFSNVGTPTTFNIPGPEYIPVGNFYYIGGSSSMGAGDGGYRLPSVVPGKPMKLFIIRSSNRKQGETLENTITRFLEENRPSHVWGGGWHYLTLAPRETVELVAVVGRFDGPRRPNWEQYRWTSTHISNFDKWTACSHNYKTCYELGTDQEQGFRSFDGALLMRFRNPPNVNGWTGDDIQYLFSK